MVGTSPAMTGRNQLSPRHPGQAKRDPGSITTGLRCWRTLGLPLGATTEACGYGFPPSRERRAEMMARRVCKAKRAHHSEKDRERWCARRFAPLHTLRPSIDDKQLRARLRVGLRRLGVVADLVTHAGSED